MKSSGLYLLAFVFVPAVVAANMLLECEGFMFLVGDRAELDIPALMFCPPIDLNAGDSEACCGISLCACA